MEANCNSIGRRVPSHRICTNRNGCKMKGGPAPCSLVSSFRFETEDHASSGRTGATSTWRIADTIVPSCFWDARRAFHSSENRSGQKIGAGKPLQRWGRHRRVWFGPSPLLDAMLLPYFRMLLCLRCRPERFSCPKANIAMDRTPKSRT